MRNATITNGNLVQAIVAFVAQGNTAQATSEKFKMTIGNVNAILSGKVHKEHTGLDFNAGKYGAKYIRENKEMFIKKSYTISPSNKSHVASPIMNSIPLEIQQESSVNTASSIYTDKTTSVIHKHVGSIVRIIDAKMRKLSVEHNKILSEMDALKSQKNQWESIYPTASY